MINVFVFSKKVIQGYEKGVPGMCRGEIRTLTVPPHLGYGERGMFVLVSFFILWKNVKLTLRKINSLVTSL